MKIKKFGSFLIVLALLVCTAAVQVKADELTEPFFYDFEDFEEFATLGKRWRYQYIEVGNQYGTDFASGEITANSEETFDKDYGRSLLLNVPESGTTPFINLWTELGQNAVVGFSAYIDDKTGFTFGSKGPSNDWGSPDTVSDIIKVRSGTLTIKDGTEVPCTAGWNHFCIGLDYTTNKITVWLNGEQVSVYQAAPEFTGTLYFNMNTNRVSGATQIGIDDMFIYYVADAEMTGSGNEGIVSPDTESYTVNMGQKVFGENVGDSVKIYDSGRTLISGTGSVSTTKYQDTVTVPLTETLGLGETYTVEVSGITDALGNAISKTLTFVATQGTYTVTAASADTGQGSAAVVTPGETLETGTSVMVQATPAEGYKFVGWVTEGAMLTAQQLTENPLVFSMPSADVKLTATFEALTEAPVGNEIPFFYNFEDYAGTQDYGCIQVGRQLGTDYASGEIIANLEEPIDKDYGRSLLLKVPESGTTPFINIQTTLTQNAVVGFSAYIDDKTYFTISSKGPSNDWNKPDTIANIILVRNGMLTTLDEVETPYTTGWNHFCIGLDYTTNNITVWLNGEKVSVYQAEPEFKSTSYLNLNTNRVSGAAQIGIDDMFVYYAADAEITGSDTDGIVEPDIESYTVNMGQKVFGANIGDSVKIYDSGNNLISGTGSVSTAGYQDTVTVPLNTDLVPGAEYTVQIAGITDMLGNSIQQSLTFSARDNKTQITLSCEETRKLPAGTVVDFMINAQNLPANDTLEVYLCDAKILEVPADTETVGITLQDGENRIFVKSVSTGVQSQEYVLEAAEYEEIASYLDTADFEDTGDPVNNLDGGNADGSRDVIDVGGEHGHVLKMSIETGEAPYTLFPNVSGVRGIIVLEGDFYFESAPDCNILSVKSENNKWFTNIQAKGSNIIAFGEAVAEVKQGEWYHMKVMYDTVDNEVSFFMNGRVYVFERDMAVEDFQGIQYCNQTLRPGKEGSPNIMYLDNLKEYVLGAQYTYLVTPVNDTGSICERLPYEGGKLRIEFSQSMMEDTLAGITVIDESGNVVEPVSTTYESSSNAYVIEFGTLLPNASYTVTIPDTVKTIAGAGGSAGTTTVLTEKTPFSIDDVTVSDAEGSCTVDVSLQDTSGIQHEAVVVLCVYEGDRLHDVKVAEVNTVDSLDITEQLTVPTGQYSVEVYLIESLTSMKCIDIYCV